MFSVQTRAEKNDSQVIAGVKHYIWLEGGPQPDLQQLFTVGSQKPLRDLDSLDQVLDRGTSLQLVVTPPATRELSIYVGWVLNYAPNNRYVEIVPYADGVFEPTYAFVETPVGHLADITVKSTWCAKRIVSKVRELLDDFVDCPRFRLCVARVDSGFGCA